MTEEGNKEGAEAGRYSRQRERREEIPKLRLKGVEGSRVKTISPMDVDPSWIDTGMADYPRYSLVKDKKTLERLNSAKTVIRYRAAQEIDGKLYSPMAGKVNGRWTNPIEFNRWEQADERPEMAHEKPGEEGSGKFYFTLDKGNGSKIEARYNPYVHSSILMLNDQFSSAYKRPELVVIEVEVPQFEIDEPYKAEKAKDATGNMSWHTGPVASRLPAGKSRVVTLSRYDKPIRKVEDSEVAKSIADHLAGENIPFPSNVVTPNLRKELEKLGVRITEGEEYKAEKKDFDAAKKSRKSTPKYSLKSFSEQVDDTLSGKLDRDTAVYVMETPEILQREEIGMKNYPMLMTQKHIRDIHHKKSKRNPHWHGIDTGTIKSLPDMILNPSMILKSVSKNGGVVIVTEKIDKDGLPIIVSIQPDGTGYYNRAEIDSNFITSMYGKNGFDSFIKKAVSENRVLYVDKKRTQSAFNKVWLQLPESLKAGGFFKRSVPQATEKVNIHKKFSRKKKIDYPLHRQFEKWKEKSGYVTPGNVDREAVRKAVRRLARTLKAGKADVEGITDRLTKLFDTASYYEGMTYQELLTHAAQVAEELVYGAEERETGLYDQYRDLRKFLRGNTFSIRPEDVEIADFKDFRKRNFGRLNLREGDRTNIDVLLSPPLGEAWIEIV